jgi:hypothetical protein
MAAMHTRVLTSLALGSPLERVSCSSDFAVFVRSKSLKVSKGFSNFSSINIKSYPVLGMESICTWDHQSNDCLVLRVLEEGPFENSSKVFVPRQHT